MRRKNATNEFLRECIADALLILMKEKEISAITISEIAELADVGRATYYRNFSSKEDVLSFKLGLLFAQGAERFNLVESRNTEELMTGFFALLLSEKEIIKILYQGNLSHIFQKFFYELFVPKANSDTFLLYKMAGTSFLLFGIVNEWIKREFRETPEQMKDITVNVVRSLLEEKENK